MSLNTIYPLISLTPQTNRNVLAFLRLVIVCLIAGAAVSSRLFAVIRHESIIHEFEWKALALSEIFARSTGRDSPRHLLLRSFNPARQSSPFIATYKGRILSLRPATVMSERRRGPAHLLFHRQGFR
ncbi:uncharacterized protein PGTG_06702 [Puccinia graminis f. sp. tritici CRL 75-36-700-3]|uniref:Uncharacterized protein n=1 Tax=Puccinia graminis f. sp. tritici (strain CRL 75-36-700-3 / race SCCL) TaxID=418459 RepID=E3K8G4_PUCGT|nr:uncharacterized protein PGTG_06702 [Puccinia graminis f. sp. tritici CRL 75-36-700-3]EFP80746.2 hypothetical protein PGTG_06702 [Puccinia graminis f. sp. tritici CRL 75-36-700-3]